MFFLPLLDLDPPAARPALDPLEVDPPPPPAEEADPPLPPPDLGMVPVLLLELLEPVISARLMKKGSSYSHTHRGSKKMCP